MTASLLRFGIPSLDELLGFPRTEPSAGRHDFDSYGYLLREDEAATVCLIGPDGTGKSLFALHLVSDYVQQLKGGAKVLYVSTDLSVDRAQMMWRSFWLDRPAARRQRIPFLTTTVRPDASHPEARDAVPEIKLKSFQLTTAAERFAEYLTTANTPTVAFLDLASTTAGDDWHLLNTILGTLDTPSKGIHAPRHLVVIDAVEGMEALVGGRDSLGELQERRARIAQVIRAAARKCHLLFVVEEPKTGERLPEVFVADVVVRLRNTTDRDYARRTVEVEKVRGQPHVRGEHDFHIRQGPSMTGPDENPDEPKVGAYRISPAGEPVFDSMSYVQVFPSLHYLSRQTRHPGPAHSGNPCNYASFGVDQLDTMMAQALVVPNGPVVLAGADSRGLAEK
jgi:KaiC/GvpD/RAD55 family RecA-like ATPase